MKKTLGSFFTLALVVTTLCSGMATANEFENLNKPEETLPNILWLSTEDIGPHIGSYDEVANTPTLDEFAKRSLVYDTAWSNYPVCAPARTTIIGGMYASANAAGNMRSNVMMPAGVEMFPSYLRLAGYYCTNNSKEDYNYIVPKGTKNNPWDESSNKAHYRGRAEGQPFFAVFNFQGTHESKIRVRPHEAITDPAAVKLPAYWPDVPEFRQDFAQYYDNINTMDGWIKKHLDDLEKSGQADNTVVIFFGDHGGGMPRHKRYAGDSGMHVPFIVHVPEKLKQLAPAEYRAGARSQRLVGFIDLAPTVLSIAGIKPPEYMQGHAFMGKFETDPPKYLYGFRDRMDERPDISRAVRDERYIYVRNYMPNVPAGQYLSYQFETPSTSVWNQMFLDGKLDEVQSRFWQPHPPEEFYDLVDDPDETKNLVDDPTFKDQLERLRKEQLESMIRFGDLGLIPESIAENFGGDKPRHQMLKDKVNFALELIQKTAGIAANRDAKSIPDLLAATKHESASVRYWGTLGLLIRRAAGVTGNEEQIEKLADDSSPAVAIVAAEILATYGDQEQTAKGVSVLTKFADHKNANFYAAIRALNSVDRLKETVEFDLVEIEKTRYTKAGRGGDYVDRLVSSITGISKPKENKKKKN